MKIYLTLFALNCIFYCCQTPNTKISISEKIKDLGVYSKNQVKEAKFIIKNIGNYPLIIENVNPDCHCTLVRWDKKGQTLPDSSTHIYVRYDNSSLGHFQQLVTFKVNTIEGKGLLIIRGKVIN